MSTDVDSRPEFCGILELFFRSDFLGEDGIISGCWDIFLDLQMSIFYREVKLYKHFCDTYPIALLEAGFLAFSRDPKHSQLAP